MELIKTENFKKLLFQLVKLILLILCKDILNTNTPFVVKDSQNFYACCSLHLELPGLAGCF